MKKCWLNEKFIILTGASSGLGKNIAQMLINKHNCTVLGIARSEDKLNKFKLDLNEKSNKFIPYVMDVGIKDNWKNLCNYLNKNNTIPDVLINCAGILPKFKKAELYTSEEVQNVLNTNFLSVTYSVEHVLPLIKKSPTPAIVNISSSSSLMTVIGTSVYSASKSALKSYTESLCLENKDVYVGLIIPGFIKTDIMRNQNLNEKEGKLINAISTDCNKATKKIVKYIEKRKKRKSIGLDAKLMNLGYKLCPNLSMKLVSKILKSFKLTLFEDVFN